MDLAHARSGLSADRLERIADHLNRNYIEPGKIAGCQVAVARHGHLAYFKSFGQMDRERGKPIGRRHHLPHLFDDQADHLGRADDALRAGLFPAERPGQPLRPGLEEPPRLGLRRRRRHGDRGAEPAGQLPRRALPHRRPHLRRRPAGRRRRSTRSTRSTPSVGVRRGERRDPARLRRQARPGAAALPAGRALDVLAGDRRLRRPGRGDLRQAASTSTCRTTSSGRWA